MCHHILISFLHPPELNPTTMTSMSISSPKSCRKNSWSSSSSSTVIATMDCGFNQSDSSSDSENPSDSEDQTLPEPSKSQVNDHIKSFLDEDDLEETQMTEAVDQHLKNIYGDLPFKVDRLVLFALNYAAPHLSSLKEQDVLKFESESVKFAQAVSKLHKKAANVIPFMHHDDTQSAEKFKYLTKNKRLHIGYVSSDLHNHVVMDFARVLIHYFDPSKFTVYIYLTCNPVAENRDTEECIKQVGKDYFRRCYGKSAQECAKMIQDDKIQILIDLAGWSGHPRLDIFCLRPAPIQVTYLGYCNTTGLNSKHGMDYRLVDSFTDLKSCNTVGNNNVDEIKDGFVNKSFVNNVSINNTRLYSETLWRLPDSMCFLCRDPEGDRSNGEFFKHGPHTRTTTPALKHPNKTFTFGSFNNIGKINQAVILVWTEILNRVQNSRLIIKGLKSYHKISQKVIFEIDNIEFAQQHQSRIRQVFESCGLTNAEQRLIFVQHQPRRNHLISYDEIDLSLDSFPYSGTSTTADSLLCSVPVLTYCPTNLVHATRVTGSILYRLGEEVKTKLIATTLSEYIEKAIALASNLQGLNELRNLIQPLFLASCVCQPSVFIRKLESEYQKMWQLFLNK